ncbi:TraR/DksA family transcriptional regulator [Iodidimonas sp. SYSU 1G8]|uniref:TraR/DksA family transcriptional regulator n=1 Tax=Iodidimonas sp. SYSU 1G8 TaxID=3133967 RepID=UPI0031FEA3B5
MLDLRKVADDLSNRLRELTDRADRLEHDLRLPLDPDFAEQATDMESAEANQALEESSRAEIVQIRAALARIEEGEYGICTTCGDPIAEARLQALPYTPQCIECARRN